MDFLCRKLTGWASHENIYSEVRHKEEDKMKLIDLVRPLIALELNLQLESISEECASDIQKDLDKAKENEDYFEVIEKLHSVLTEAKDDYGIAAYPALKAITDYVLTECPLAREGFTEKLTATHPELVGVLLGGGVLTLKEHLALLIVLVDEKEESAPHEYVVDVSVVMLQATMDMSKKHRFYDNLVDSLIQLSISVVGPDTDPSEYGPKFKQFLDHVFAECPEARAPFAKELEENDPSLVKIFLE